MSPSPKDDATPSPVHGLLKTLVEAPSSQEPMLKALGSAFALAKDPSAILEAQRQVREYMTFLDGMLEAVEHPTSRPSHGSTTAFGAPSAATSDYVDGRVRTGLSARELEIVRLVASGQTVGNIAQALEISAHTVRNHLKACYRKVGVHTQIEMVNYAFAHGLVTRT